MKPRPSVPKRKQPLRKKEVDSEGDSSDEDKTKEIKKVSVLLPAIGGLARTFLLYDVYLFVTGLCSGEKLSYAASSCFT